MELKIEMQLDINFLTEMESKNGICFEMELEIQCRNGYCLTRMELK